MLRRGITSPSGVLLNIINWTFKEFIMGGLKYRIIIIGVVSLVLSLSACVSLPTPKVTVSCHATLTAGIGQNGSTSYFLEFASSANSGSTGDVTPQDLNNADLSTVYLQIALQGAQISSGAGTYTLQLYNGTQLVAQNNFNYVMDGTDVIPSDPTAVKSWLAGYVGQADAVHGVVDVPVTPAVGATSITGTATIEENGTDLVQGSAFLQLGTNPKCPPLLKNCQPQ